MIKVLSVGQLPKVAGGTYTTGVANVVYELSKQKIDDIELYVFATNTDAKTARKNNTPNCRYLGYTKNYLGMLWGIIRNPRETYEAWQLYKKTNNVSPLHIEFIKYNYERVIKEVNPDIIHVHNSMDAMFYANKHLRKTVLYTLHGLMWCGEDDLSNQEIKWKTAAQLLLPLAKHYSTLNEKAQKKMLKLGVNIKDITIIPNGVDTKKFFYSCESRAIKRKEMLVPDSTFVFITVGAVIDRKGQFMFLKLIEKLGLEYQYWIIGNGPDCELIRNYSQNNHLESRIRMIGYVKDIDIYTYLSAADFYVHGSTVEGQALSEIEAYATGLRTIVNRFVADTVVGEIKDTYHYHVLDFESPDYNSLLNWIRVPISERKTQPKYDWSVIANMYGDLYKRLLDYDL